MQGLQVQAVVSSFAGEGVWAHTPQTCEWQTLSPCAVSAAMFSMVRVQWPFPGVADVRQMDLTGDLESLAHLESAESVSSFPLLWGT